MIPLLLKEGPEIPGRWRNFAGANQQSILLRERGDRPDRAEPDAVGFQGNFQFVARLKRKAFPQGFRHDHTAHFVQGESHWQ